MQLSDQDLIQQYLNGSERAFETFCWPGIKAKIYISIYLFTRDKIAEDIFQEVFIKIIDTLRKGNYNHEGKFLQWAMDSI